MGGLREGGQHYYALDVTNPDGIAGPGGTNLAYPGFQASGPAYGWEFPRRTIRAPTSPLMGETWSQPIITRVKVSVNNDGVAHERWVAIVTAGYDETGDPNPHAGDRAGVSVYDADAPRRAAAIFILDVKTGEVLAEKKFDAGASGRAGGHALHDAVDAGGLRPEHRRLRRRDLRGRPGRHGSSSG